MNSTCSSEVPTLYYGGWCDDIFSKVVAHWPNISRLLPGATGTVVITHDSINTIIYYWTGQGLVVIVFTGMWHQLDQWIHNSDCSNNVLPLCVQYAFKWPPRGHDEGDLSSDGDTDTNLEDVYECGHSRWVEHNPITSVPSQHQSKYQHCCHPQSRVRWTSCHLVSG